VVVRTDIRQLSNSSYWYSYAASGILRYCGQTANKLHFR